MPSVRINSELSNHRIYFLTFTVQHWYYLFDRHNRFQILADSLQYCQNHKDLKLYAYVFMLNHVHLVAEAPDMVGFVRDFKKFTSKSIHENIVEFEPQVLALFQDQEGTYEFWARTNMPKLIESEKFLLQKVDYIHSNPVQKQYVLHPEHWYWSSAHPESAIRVSPLPV